MPRRKPKTPHPAVTIGVAASIPTPGNDTNTVAERSSNTASATRTRTRTATKPTKKYESTPVPQQLTFPARRKVVRTYGGGRRSLPARLETTPGSETRRSLRQQTLTQIDYVRSSSGLAEGDAEEGLRVDDDEVDEAGEGQEELADGGSVGRKGKRRKQVAVLGAEKMRSERGSKRRKTMGDSPMPIPGLERKGSSFHTQTLTQFLGTSASRAADEEDDGLRVEDEDEDEVEDLPLPGGTPARRPPLRDKGKGKAPLEPMFSTPSHKRIKVNLDEVPCSQTSTVTPSGPRNQIQPIRSPLTQMSTNLDAPSPTIETISKLPRNLVIQDSYSIGGSEGIPSSTASDSPIKGEETPSQKPKREPLSEIPLASLELGVGSTPNGETPTSRRKRMFVEIPDSDDDLQSIGSTPFGSRSAQQTPLKREVFAEDVEVDAGPDSGSRAARFSVSGTPASLGRSDKENESPVIRVWEEEEAGAGEGEGPGSATPKLGRKSQATARASQVSPNTASQFWTASAEDVGGTGTSLREPLAELVVPEEPLVNAQGSGTPNTAPRASQFFGSMGESARKVREVTPQLEDTDETASEAEEEHVPTSILRRSTTQRTPRPDSGKKRKSTPEPVTSESSTDEAPGTPTPVVRRVQIVEPPPGTAEEVYEETPRKPHKSSPLFQRHTQARSQLYTQGLESQRVSLQVIRSLSPQTDRSDILISIHPNIVEEIFNGERDHEFRSYKFPPQVVRCWIYTTHPVNEVKYMATLGPAQEPGQIDSGTGIGNAEFNAGKSRFKFAHKLRQVYQLNNPVPLADMPDNGLGDGPPQKYRYLPPAIVGQLLANLRCALFVEEYEEDTEGDEGEEKVTISQELEEQLRSDIIHSTQMASGGRDRREEEEDIIPASQSPLKNRSAPPADAQKPPNNNFARPAVPTRSSQRLRNQQSQTTLPQPQRSNQTMDKKKPAPYVRLSQATTASDISIPSSSAVSFPAAKSSASLSLGPASIPRPPLPGSSELSSLPSLGGLHRDSEDGDEDEDSLLPLPQGGMSSLLLTSSQAGVLPMDSLLGEEVGMAPPPVEVWDSDDEGEGS